MAKRPYPRKAENERRITVSFSISGPMLAGMREKLEKYMHTPPSVQEVQAFARGLAYDAVEDYIAKPFVPDDDEE